VRGPQPRPCAGMCISATADRPSRARVGSSPTALGRLQWSMLHTTSRFIGLTVVVTLTATGLDGVRADERVTLRVTPAVSQAPAFVRVTASVQRDPSNRWLEVIADSGEYFRSSRINLAGEQAPRVSDIELRDLPGGEYRIIAILVDDRGHTSSTQRAMTVVPSPAER
jgi:hypothetical protein